MRSCCNAVVVVLFGRCCFFFVQRRAEMRKFDRGVGRTDLDLAHCCFEVLERDDEVQNESIERDFRFPL